MAIEIKNELRAAAIVDGTDGGPALQLFGMTFERTDVGVYTFTMADDVDPTQHSIYCVPGINELVLPRGRFISADVLEVRSYRPDGAPADCAVLFVEVHRYPGVVGATFPDAPAVLGTPLDIFVRDVGGDDANPGTEALPVKTFAAAVALIPQTVNARVTVHVGDHGGTGYAMPMFGTRFLNANVFIFGDGAGVGDGKTETLASTVMQAGSDEGTIVGTGGYTIDAFRGHTLEITSGVCVGYRRSIHSNTADNFNLIVDTDRLGLSPSPGDTFEIFRPSVVINFSEGFASGEKVPVGNGISEGRAAGMLVLAQLALTATQIQDISFRGIEVGFFGVEQDNPSGSNVNWFFEDQNVWIGTDSANGQLAEVVTEIGAPDGAAWNGYGHFRVDAAANDGGPFGNPDSGDGLPARIVAYIVSNKGFHVSQFATIRGSIIDTAGVPALEFETAMLSAGWQGAWWVGNTAFTTHKTVLSAVGAADCINLTTIGFLDLRSVDMRWVDGIGIDVSRGAQVNNTSSFGEPSGTGTTVAVGGGGLYIATGSVDLGHAANLDYVVAGQTGINKTDLVNPGDGVIGPGGTIVKG